MQILLREYGNDVYVWKTAKYNDGHFIVDGEVITECSIVSIINDNRKNYIQCSSCGKVFRKGDRRFEEHKVNAIKPDVCFGCSKLLVDNICIARRQIVANNDGTFAEKRETCVNLRCANTGLWSYSDITSETAISHCRKRQCANANANEIDDFFTRNPGAFDDIITIDRLMEDGHNPIPNHSYNIDYAIVYEEDYTIYAIINKFGIVNCFEVWTDGDSYRLYYSKKYDKLFYDRNGYVEWDLDYLYDYVVNEVKEKIANLYR